MGKMSGELGVANLLLGNGRNMSGEFEHERGLGRRKMGRKFTAKPHHTPPHSTPPTKSAGVFSVPWKLDL